MEALNSLNLGVVFYKVLKRNISKENIIRELLLDNYNFYKKNSIIILHLEIGKIKTGSDIIYLKYLLYLNVL